MPAIPLSDVLQLHFPEVTGAPRDSVPSPTGKVTSPRSRNRAAAWAQDMARAHAYMSSRARSEAEQEAADRLYEEALRQGPDFTRYRTGSDFREAPRLNIDRNAYARIIFALEMIERGTYRHSRKKGKQGIPRTAARVLKALLGLAMRHGRVYPSLLGLAQLACVCKQTVVECLKLLELYGFVVVHRRCKRIRTPLGFKVVQDTNAYTVQEPRGLGALALSVFQRASESRKLAASSFQSHSIKEQKQNPLPWGIPDGVYGNLRVQWEAS
ncbi:hypothetical protein [Rhodovulum sp. PH10]|uniref:hypothetical protein n=1 Tax=Rhodovulum sp. PH10 TaxID=1187851 RepID=UPI00058DEBD1|nr:hypothetical protein [Rhodovulum sp. PH10]